VSARIGETQIELWLRDQKARQRREWFLVGLGAAFVTISSFALTMASMGWRF
jgi:hypothetical protein